MSFVSLFFSVNPGQCNKKDPCEEMMCANNGVCHDGRCHCQDGFEGSMCQHKIDKCDPNPCRHGRCEIDDRDEIMCRCDDGFEG